MLNCRRITNKKFIYQVNLSLSSPSCVVLFLNGYPSDKFLSVLTTSSETQGFKGEGDGKETGSKFSSHPLPVEAKPWVSEDILTIDGSDTLTSCQINLFVSFMLSNRFHVCEANVA